ncbi:2-dehydro-3-deoxygalactonokinase [Halobacillus sp. K22]|uniref:2-dehydro-3-deoxygalactonokinase n=1 Tax=Halobacillus sp. K22 TaxID=3457431 RepID=UPI003FCCAEFF
MAKIIIDCGTTNSRLRLAAGENDKMTDVLKIEAGIRNTAMDGNTDRLKSYLQEGIRKLIERNELELSDVDYMAASGMITSNIGLFEVPHVKGPAGVKDLAAHVKVVRLEEFFHIPCLFIPGMKSTSLEGMAESSFIDKYDVMRGEEVESIGLWNQQRPEGEGLMVLPGSHTKFVFVEADGTLKRSYTTLTGELLKAVQSETILSGSLQEELIESFAPDSFNKGFEACEKVGVTRALFHVRLLDLQGELDANGRANYLAGVLFHEDWKAIKLELSKLKRLSWVMVGGSSPLKELFLYLLQKLEQDWKIHELDEKSSDMAAFHGALEIIKAYEEEQK